MNNKSIKHKNLHLMKIFIFSFAYYFLLIIPANAQSNFDLMFGPAAKYQKVEVIRVLAPDLITVESTSPKGEVIKLIGLRSPEGYAYEQFVEEKPERDEFGFRVEEEVDLSLNEEDEAYEFVNELLRGKMVRLEFDTYKVDDKNRTAAYVYLVDDNMFVNYEIIRQGHARLQIRPPNTKHADKLKEAYKQARDEKRGLYSK